MYGKLFTFEGGEGTGKSSQIKLAKEYLESKGYEVVTSREPGGTEISEEIRKTLKRPRQEGITMSTRAELLLFEAARAQIIDERVKPWLEVGKIVTFDRFYDSTTVYQGYARGIDMSWIRKLNQYATDGIKPDLTFLLDVSVETGFSRVTTEEFNGLDRMEQAGREFHEKVRAGYLDLAKKEERFRVIDTEHYDKNLSMEENIQRIHLEVRKHLDEILK